LNDTLSITLADAFPFLGARCERITNSVMARIDPEGRHDLTE